MTPRSFRAQRGIAGFQVEGPSPLPGRLRFLALRARNDDKGLTHQQYLIYYRTMASSALRVRAGQASTAQLFHALSDETRLAVLDMLRGGERCVCDLQGDLDAAQSRLSFHLKVLRDAGLVTDRKEGRWSYYALVPERLAEAEAYLAELQRTRSSAPSLVQLNRSNGEDASNRRASRASAARRSSRDSCCS
jgi:ArsR family transcriptional regulator